MEEEDATPMKINVYLGDDGVIDFRLMTRSIWPVVADGSFSCRPGEKLFGRTYEQWRALLEQYGGLTLDTSEL